MKTFETFLVEKGITKDVFTTKGAGEMASLYNEYNENARKEINAAVETKASKEEVEKMKADFLAAKNEQFETLTAQLKSQGEELKELGLTLKKVSINNSLTKKHDSVREGLEKNIEKLKSLAGSDMNAARAAGFSFKAAADMLASTNISGGNVPVEQRIAGLNTVASRRVRLLDIVAKGSAASNVISWVYQANKDGAAGGTAEGALKNQIDFDMVVANQVVVKRTAYIKVSDEMIADIDFINTEINNELMRELLKDVESQAYSGNGTAPNLNGIRTVATAFAAGSFATAVDNANEADVLTVAINQIMIANQPMPNYILMHPSDVTKLKLYKVSTTDRRYIDRLALIAGELTLDGIPIIPTTLVTATEYLVGAFDMATLYDKGEVQIEIGLDGNDFTKNMRTIRAEWRGAMVVKNNDRTAFVKGDFDTDKNAIETP
jgi:molybdenum-dependent DNA-binding transcriptional regulator ModE